ncbi:hypothetical protein NDK43_06745 [Neobacillus pocheonensis]|uniref:Uncharacterized protein n=1 Tax=Neobacillus pocheonensis TaxID=363869 RepID=A0ABT0W746_9BACI|nr:hypothetical protein [Neobacillus pocheonensis]
MNTFDKFRQQLLAEIKEQEEAVKEAIEVRRKSETWHGFCENPKQEPLEIFIIERKHPLEELWITDQIYLLNDPIEEEN